MLRQLRFDFYKITKSKVIGWCFIIPLLILLIGPANTYIINTSAMSTISNLRAVSGNLNIALYVVGIVFITSDFSSGYIKNVYQFSNKLQYLLSKVIYVFIFCVLFLGLEFLIGWMFNTIWGNETFIDPMMDDVKAYLFTMIAELLNGVALGIFLCFLSSLVKKNYIVFIIAFSYTFVLGNLLYSAINGLFPQDSGFVIQPYTLFGFIRPNIYYMLKNDGNYLTPIFVQICYIVVFGFFSWLILKKRDVV